MYVAFKSLLALLLLCPNLSFCQNQPAGPDLPAGFLNKVQNKTTRLDRQLTRQTEKYLRNLERREARLQKKLSAVPWPDASQQYSAFTRKIKTDTGSRSGAAVSGEYQPYTDSLRTSLAFLQQNRGGSGTAGIGMKGAAAVETGTVGIAGKEQARLQGAVSGLQTLEAKMQDADQVKDFVRQRKEQINQYLSQYSQLPAGIRKEYQGISQELYYYSQQVRQYKEALNHPEELEQKALNLLCTLPAFQNYLKAHSQLSGLFSMPGNYGTPEGLEGLQSRDQVAQLIQGQVSAGGSNALPAIRQNVESAQTQLNTYKDKLSQLGGGSGDIDMPDFTPNTQRTKTFLKRLEYGVNMQTVSSSYYFPTTTDLAGSLGYKLSNSSSIGVGVSYKLGWGSGIQHISFSSQGIGLRSYLDIRVKGSWFASGGFEYNYRQPFSSAQQLRHLDDWSRSGLLGISKILSVKSRVFSKTKLQLLWDFLSYQQVPVTTPLLFRVGYTF